MRARPAGTCLLLTLALLCATRVGPAQERIWNPDDRIVISSFNDVLAIAYDGRRVFGATRNGLEIYEELSRRWLSPSTVEDGYPVMERPTAIAYDRGQNGLWLTTSTGNEYLWSELTRRWELRFPGSAPRELLRTSVLPADPALRVMRGSLTLDPSGRRWPTTGITAGERPGTYWIASGGGNIAAADSRNLSVQWLSFGTLSRGVSALAVDRAGHIWFGGDGNGPRDGITRTDNSLQDWSSYDAFSARAPRRAIRCILPGDTTWLGAADGIYVLLPAARSWRRLDERGMPSSSVRALARTSEAVWAGTQQGLTVFENKSMASVWRSMEGVRINGLAVRNDTVWIASDVGLWLGTADGTSFRVTQPPGIDTRPTLRRQVTGVALAGNAIAVLAQDGVRVFVTEWSDVIATATAEALGRPVDLRASGERLFVLGANVVAEWNRRTDSWRRLTVPADLPEGPVRDVTRQGDFIWVATPAGAIRLFWP